MSVEFQGLVFASTFILLLGPGSTTHCLAGRGVEALSAGGWQWEVVGVLLDVPENRILTSIVPYVATSFLRGIMAAK